MNSPFQMLVRDPIMMALLALATTVFLICFFAAVLGWLARRVWPHHRVEAPWLTVALVLILAAPMIPGALYWSRPVQLERKPAQAAGEVLRPSPPTSAVSSPAQMTPGEGPLSLVAPQRTISEASGTGPRSIGSFLAGTWALGVLLVGGLHILRSRRFRCQVDQLPDWNEGSCAEMVRQESLRLGLPESKLKRCDSMPPFILGGIPSTLALPGAIRELPEVQVRSIVLHELYHLRLGHVRQKQLADVVRCLYGWIPGVGWVLRRLELAQDCEGDAMVSQDQGSGRPLAETLLWFAERALTPTRASIALALFGPASPLSERIESLKNARSILMNPQLTRRVTLGAVTVCMAATALTLSALDVVPQRTADSTDFFPFVEGSRWVYEVTSAEGVQTETWTAWSRKNVSPIPVLEFLKESTTPSGKIWKTFDYFAWNRQGLTGVWRTTLISSEPGFEPPREDGMILPKKPQKGQTWTWKEPFRGQITVDPKNPKPKWPDPSTLRGRVLSVDEPTDLRIGRRPATVVEIEQTAEWGKSSIRYTFVRGVGLAKTEYIDGQGKVYSRQELTAFLPQTEPPPAMELAMPIHQKSMGAKSRSPQLRPIESEAIMRAFRSRFFLSESLQDLPILKDVPLQSSPESPVRKLIRVVNGRAEAFSPENLDDVRRLVADEKISDFESDSNGLPRPVFTRLLVPLAQLVAAERGLDPARVQVKTEYTDRKAMSRVVAGTKSFWVEITWQSGKLQTVRVSPR